MLTTDMTVDLHVGKDDGPTPIRVWGPGLPDALYLTITTAGELAESLTSAVEAFSAMYEGDE